MILWIKFSTPNGFRLVGWLFLLALVARGLGAPLAGGKTPAYIPPAQSSATAPTPESDYQKLYRASHKDWQSLIQARAAYLYDKAQSQTERPAVQWLDQHCRSVAGDVAGLDKQFGRLTGEASQYGQASNRLGEVTACYMAMNWIANGGYSSEFGSSTLNRTLKTYGEVYRNRR